MILVSSLRPWKECPYHIAANQREAFASWRQTGNTVVYFNEGGDELEGVSWMPCVGKPTIQRLAAYGSVQNSWSAIVNADIILGPTWPAVEQAIRSSGAKCAISRRYQLPPDGDQAKAKLVDQGLDIFVARPEVWKEIAKFVPRQFTLGRILFDTWLMSFFVHNFRCADFTDARVVFHPLHGDRNDQAMVRSSDNYLDVVRWPGLKIGPQTMPLKPAVKTEGGGQLKV